MPDDQLCPFSKPIIGDWCQCKHAHLTERCSGKMACLRSDDLYTSCEQLVNQLKITSRFVLSISDKDSELTHAQLMKIRCGGIAGMQRILFANNESTIPDIPHIVSQCQIVYGTLDLFPYDKIIRDIKDFTHRKKLRT